MNKKQIILIIGLFFLSLLIAGFLSDQINKKNKKTPAENQTSQRSWNQILAGKTTINELNNTLGIPVSTDERDGSLLYRVAGKNYSTHSVYSSNNIIHFIKRRVFPPENVSFISLTSDLLEQPVVLLGPEAQMNIFLYAYPESGVAYLANKDADRVYEIWYFPPISLAGLLQMRQISGYILNK